MKNLHVPSIEYDIVQCAGNEELFLIIDDCVQCYNENEYYDNILDEIAERILQNEESDSDDKSVKITNDAEKCIRKAETIFREKWRRKCSKNFARRLYSFCQ